MTSCITNLAILKKLVTECMPKHTKIILNLPTQWLTKPYYFMIFGRSFWVLVEMFLIKKWLSPTKNLTPNSGLPLERSFHCCGRLLLQLLFPIHYLHIVIKIFKIILVAWSIPCPSWTTQCHWLPVHYYHQQLLLMRFYLDCDNLLILKPASRLSCLLVKVIIHKRRPVLFPMDMVVHWLLRSLNKQYVEIWCHHVLRSHIYSGKQH